MNDRAVVRSAYFCGAVFYIAAAYMAAQLESLWQAAFVTILLVVVAFLCAVGFWVNDR